VNLLIPYENSQIQSRLRANKGPAGTGLWGLLKGLTIANFQPRNGSWAWI